MKKTYIAPEVEITRFNTEDIMAGSAITTAGVGEEAYTNADKQVDLSYDKLFNA